jgi:hypothetical protein
MRAGCLTVADQLMILFIREHHVEVTELIVTMLVAEDLGLARTTMDLTVKGFLTNLVAHKVRDLKGGLMPAGWRVNKEFRDEHLRTVFKGSRIAAVLVRVFLSWRAGKKVAEWCDDTLGRSGLFIILTQRMNLIVKVRHLGHSQAFECLVSADMLQHFRPGHGRDLWFHPS